MSDHSGTNDWRKDAVALGLAAGGGFLILLAVLTLRAGEVPRGGGALPALARATVGVLGLVPVLLGGIATAGAGTWLYLTGRREGVLLHVAGALCTAAGLAVLLGALTDGAGGRFGELTGGWVSGFATKAGGALFGMVVLATPVWMFWLRERVDLSRLQSLLERDATRPAADAEAKEAGVSALEAEALAPRMSAGTAAPGLENPYPEDVRLKGGLPEGTLPLDADGYVRDDTETHESADAEPYELFDPPVDASVHRWTPERGDAADEPAGADLAAEPRHAPRGASWEGLDRPDEFEGYVDALDDSADDSSDESSGAGLNAAAEPEPDDAEPFVEEVGDVRPIESDSLETADSSGDDPDDPFAAHTYAASGRVEAPEPSAADAPRVAEPYQPPRPSWEIAEEDDDPLLAVPISDEVAEALGETEPGTGDERDAAAAAAQPDDETDARSATVAESEEDEEAEDEESDEELEDTRAEGDEDEDDEYEYEYEYEYEEEEEPEEEPSGTYASSDDEESGESEESDEYDEEEDPEEEREDKAEEDDEEYEDEEEYEEEEEPEEQLEETYAEDDEAADEADDDAAPVDGAEPELAPDPRPVAANGSPRGESTAAAADDDGSADARQMDLFDDSAPAATDSGDDEPEVVLAPTAAEGDAARKVSADLLADAGNLLLRENRVAVSMLQKRFDLDFDRSCQILDELQELGLIGPYVDGSRRDILMTSEEWLELTGRTS